MRANTYFSSWKYDEGKPAIELNIDGELADLILTSLKNKMTEAAKDNLVDDAVDLAKAAVAIQNALDSMAQYDAKRIKEAEGYAE